MVTEMDRHAKFWMAFGIAIVAVGTGLVLIAGTIGYLITGLIIVEIGTTWFLIEHATERIRGWVQ